MASRDRVCNQILLYLDRKPCHGYELHRLLTPVVGDVEVTKLYRWLREMERNGLVECEERKGPYGPARRVYQLGDRGERQVRQVLKDAMGTILHFYDAFRQFSMRETMAASGEVGLPAIEGPVLACCVTQFMASEPDLVRTYGSRLVARAVHVMGDPESWERAGFKTTLVDGVPWDISCPSSRYVELWFFGMPPRELLPRTAVEARRVLRPGGVLRLVAPFAFFDEPQSPTLEAFFRMTASHLFPELGVVEAQEVCTIFDRLFGDCAVLELHPGFVEFSGVSGQLPP